MDTSIIQVASQSGPSFCNYILTVVLDGWFHFFSLSEPNELCVGPVFSDIPSQDAANTVANYFLLKKSNRSKRNW